MVLSIKHEILSQLRRIGLHFEPMMLRVLPPDQAASMINEDGIGRTFAIDLPPDTNTILPHADKINRSIIKNLRSHSIVIDSINFAHSQTSQILFQVNFECLVKELFNDYKQNLNKLCSHHRRLEESEDDNKGYAQKIIVEYSSPNIAKPFHVGNFRSTIIGNCIANLMQFKGHDVVRMNYLGDWGTQFGILSLAYDQFGDEQQLFNEPLKHLYQVYVKGNQASENDASWREAAKERFRCLELRENTTTFQQWTQFRELSLNELMKLYARLGIEFDIYMSESMYSNSSYEIIKILQEKGLIQNMDGAVYAVVAQHDNVNQTIQVPLLKSDGSTLYLTRDIAAVMHRKSHFKFDRMYYVVDSSQAKHFSNLKSIFYSIEDNVYRDIKHLKFGRIIGMSTRRGSTIFLDELLNEAKSRAIESIKSSPNTKIAPEEYDEVADVLGISSIVVQDLSNRRVKEYRFNWNKALKMTGNTGISLQYTHARLCNLLKNCQVHLDPGFDLNIAAIDTKNGRILINLLAMFDEVINQSLEELEPSILTNYLFELKTAINRANQELTIKGQTEDIAQTRFHLFVCSLNVLNQSMKLLGLRPLESM